MRLGMRPTPKPQVRDHGKCRCFFRCLRITTQNASPPHIDSEASTFLPFMINRIVNPTCRPLLLASYVNSLFDAFPLTSSIICQRILRFSFMRINYIWGVVKWCSFNVFNHNKTLSKKRVSRYQRLVGCTSVVPLSMKERRLVVNDLKTYILWQVWKTN